jgi:Putative Ig domain
MNPTWKKPARAGLLAVVSVLAACGGGWDISIGWHGGTCALAPPLATQPPKLATVGQPYTVQLTFDTSDTCGAWPGHSSCFDVPPVQLPPGASYDPATGRLTWTPSPDQALTTPVFEIATVTRDCGHEVSWSWAVYVSV